MPAVTITDLNNAKVDVDFVAEIATSEAPTAIDRLGNEKMTMAGVQAYAEQRIDDSMVELTEAVQTTGEDRAATAADVVITDAARVAAEAARDSINTSGKVFTAAEGTTAGIAATTSGQGFAVLSADNTYWVNWRNNAGVAALIGPGTYTKAHIDNVFGSNPMVVSQFFESTVQAYQNSTLRIDAAGNLMKTEKPDFALLGGFFETTRQIAEVKLDQLGNEIPADSGGTSSADVAALTAKMAAAAGSQVDLATRLSHGLTPYGDPIGPYSNRWALIDTAMRLRKLALGEKIQYVIGIGGDSYTQNERRYIRRLAKALQDAYGFAGCGLVSFAWFGTASGTWVIGGAQPTGMDLTARSDLAPVLVPNADPELVTYQPFVQLSGDWACAYFGNSTPSLSSIVSTTPGNFVRFYVPAGHDSSKLFYSGDGTGVVAISWDDGATYGANLALTTATPANIALTGTPTTATWARIKVVSGTVRLCDVSLDSSAAGVRIHKLGSSGSSIAQWAAVNAAAWSAQIAALGLHCYQHMDGTNTQTSGTATSAFTTSLGTVFDNVNSVLPYCDKVIAMPAENQRTTNAIPMASYAQAAREFALNRSYAFVDTQLAFGPANNPASYGWTNAARQFYASDQIHPTETLGGPVLANVFIDFYKVK